MGKVRSPSGGPGRLGRHRGGGRGVGAAHERGRAGSWPSRGDLTGPWEASAAVRGKREDSAATDLPAAMFTAVGDELKVRKLAEMPGPWWDDLCLRARSPWHSLGAARLQASFGGQPSFFVVEDGSGPRGVVSAYILGARRFALADRAFMRTAFVPDGPALPAPDPAGARLLVEEVDRYLSSQRVVVASWRWEWPGREGVEHLSGLGFSAKPYGVSVIELPERVEEIDSVIHGKSRNLVKKALKSGINVVEDKGVDVLLPLLDSSFERSGLPCRDHEYIRRARDFLGARVLTASLNGRPIASVMWSVFGTVACYLFHGRADGETAGASNLLLREMFSRSLEAGARWVHGGDVALPGDRDPHLLGITHFKTRMGFEVRETHSATKTYRPIAKALRTASLHVWDSLHT